MKLTLKKPVELGKEGQPITELIFREHLVSGDLRDIKASSLADPTIADILKIGGRLCAQPDAVMNRLGMADLAAVSEVVGGFLQSGLETGTEQSQ